MEGSLSGIKVLDLGAYGVGPMVAGYMGMLGAEAIRVEPPGGDGLMYMGTPVSGVGAGYISSNFNKKNIVLDLKSEEGREVGFRLVKWADVLIDNRRLGALERIGFGYEAVSKMNPRLVYVVSSTYGRQGPWNHYAGADHTVQAASGFASLNGKEGGDGELFRFIAHVDMNATLVILEAVLLGLLAREVSGKGQRIDTSHFESSFSMQTSRIAEFFATGVNPERIGSRSSVVVPSQSFLTLDRKYINISVPREEYWPGLCQALELEHIQHDPRFDNNANRVKNQAELIPILAERIRDKPARWWLIQLQRHDVPCGTVYAYDDVIRDPHVLENQMVVDLQTPWGMVMFSNGPWQFSMTPAKPVEAPVYPGRNRDEILQMLGRYGESPASEVGSRHANAETADEGVRKSAPLEGLKVLDLTEEISGPFCSMQLSDVGAEVIKVENLSGDWSRCLGPSIKGESALFMALNRNKKSIVLDISQEGGREVVYRLAKEADVFVENFRPGIADKLGVGYEDIRRINPRIIYASISPFGESGPYKNRAASELEIQGMSTHMWPLGEVGEAPVRVGADIAATNTGMWAFIGILVALFHRGKSGYGQKVGVSMLGSLLAMANTWIGAQSNPDKYIGYNLTAPFDHAETGCRTKDLPVLLGFITRGPEQARKAWRDFCKRLGLEALLSDPQNEMHAARMVGVGRDFQEMKPVLEPALKDKSSDELINIINEVGGMGAAFNDYETLFGEPLHPQVAATGIVSELEHPVAGKIRTIGFPWKFQDTPARIKSPAPTLGQHTREILAGLGYSEESITRLRREKIIS